MNLAGLLAVGFLYVSFNFVFGTGVYVRKPDDKKLTVWAYILFPVGIFIGWLMDDGLDDIFYKD